MDSDFFFSSFATLPKPKLHDNMLIPGLVELCFEIIWPQLGSWTRLNKVDFICCPFLVCQVAELSTNLRCIRWPWWPLLGALLVALIGPCIILHYTISQCIDNVGSVWPDIRVGSNIILHHITRPGQEGGVTLAAYYSLFHRGALNLGGDKFGNIYDIYWSNQTF